MQRPGYCRGELIGVTNDVMTERKLDLSEDTQIVGTIKILI